MKGSQNTDFMENKASFFGLSQKKLCFPVSEQGNADEKVFCF